MVIGAAERKTQNASKKAQGPWGPLCMFEIGRGLDVEIEVGRLGNGADPVGLRFQCRVGLEEGEGGVRLTKPM